MKNLKEIIGILAVMILVSIAFGCTDNSGVNATSELSEPQPTDNYTVIICPNPDCVLHDPNGYVHMYGSSGESTPDLRPIDMAVDRDMVFIHFYQCQVCSAQWDDRNV